MGSWVIFSVVQALFGSCLTFVELTINWIIFTIVAHKAFPDTEQHTCTFKMRCWENNLTSTWLNLHYLYHQKRIIGKNGRWRYKNNFITCKKVLLVNYIRLSYLLVMKLFDQSKSALLKFELHGQGKEWPWSNLWLWTQNVEM